MSEEDDIGADCPNLCFCPMLLRDLRFDNLNLIWEYLCVRNEFAAICNRLRFNKMNPGYKQMSFQGLFAPMEEATSGEVKLTLSDAWLPWGEGYGEDMTRSRTSLLSHPSYSRVPWDSTKQTHEPDNET